MGYPTREEVSEWLADRRPDDLPQPKHEKAPRDKSEGKAFVASVWREFHNPITPDFVQERFTSLCEYMEEPDGQIEHGALVEGGEQRFEDFMRVRGVAGMSRCLHEYVVGELDYVAPGNCGLGRTTAYIPRFGGYFRTYMTCLSDEDWTDLYLSLLDLTLAGYFGYLVSGSTPVEASKFDDVDKLFQAWVPAIYSTALVDFREDMLEVMRISAGWASPRYGELLEKHGMKGGGLFKGDKTSVIAVHYGVAGFWLSVLEDRGSA